MLMLLNCEIEFFEVLIPTILHFSNTVRVDGEFEIRCGSTSISSSENALIYSSLPIVNSGDIDLFSFSFSPSFSCSDAAANTNEFNNDDDDKEDKD